MLSRLTFPSSSRGARRSRASNPHPEVRGEAAPRRMRRGFPLLRLGLLDHVLGHAEMLLDDRERLLGEGFQLGVLTLFRLLLEQVDRLLMLFGHGRHVALVELLPFQLGEL